MSRTDPQVNFRIPAELKEKLEAAAAENKRSVTAELVARLQESFAPSSFSMPETVKRVASALSGEGNDKRGRLVELQRQVTKVGVAVFEATARIHFLNSELINVISDEDRERINSQLMEAYVELGELERNRRVLSEELLIAKRELIEKDFDL
jgi:hypothetical protein